jgi:hypothetical protein
VLFFPHSFLLSFNQYNLLTRFFLVRELDKKKRNLTNGRVNFFIANASLPQSYIYKQEHALKYAEINAGFYIVHTSQRKMMGEIILMRPSLS